MPPRANQSNASLYSAIFFAVVFIAATVFAVVFYLKSEDNRKMYLDTQSEMEELARGREKTEVGQRSGRNTYLGTMLDYMDKLAENVGGVSTEDATAEVQFNEIMSAIDQMYNQLNSAGFNTADQSLIRVMEMLNNQRIAAMELAAANENALKKLQNEFDAAQEAQQASLEKMQGDLKEQKQMADAIQQKYDDLQALIDDKFGEQISSLTDRYENTRDSLQEAQNELLQTTAQLNQAKERLDYYQGIIESIKPQPLKEIKAFIPDGQIVSVDPATGIVILNLGSDDHVYPGLTFAVYNKNAPIPPDGKGKAEVEIFDVEKRISIARIKPESVDPKQSIIAEDPIANLIWDADAANTFIVAGEFDIDGDGRRDADGKEKIKQMIIDWGGQIADSVTIKTDFVVLGTKPMVGTRPDTTSLDYDPMALDKYEETVKAAEFYDTVIEKASNFSIPVFDVSRFMYFIGQGEQLK